MSTPLPCSKSEAFEAVAGLKKDINAKLAGGKAVLNSLKSDMTSFKSKVLSAIPKLPVLDSFQKELAGLVGAGPSAIAAFVLKWKGKVTGLDTLVAKVTGGIAGLVDFSFCQDVPNVKMDPVTQETVKEPPESKPVEAVPVPPPPVVPTVVNKVVEPVAPTTSITTEIVTKY